MPSATTQELFRFVNIRKTTAAPFTPVSSGPVSFPAGSYDEWAAAAHIEPGVVLSQLIAAKASADEKSEFTKLAAAAMDIRENETEYYRTGADVFSSFPGFDKLFNWIVMAEAGSITYNNIVDRSVEFTGQQPNYWFSKNDLILKLWNTISLESIVQTDARLSEAVTHVLQTLIILSANQQQYPGVFSKAREAVLVLPSAIFPYIRPHEEPDEAPGNNDVSSRIEVLYERLQHIAEATQDLQGALRAEAEDAKIELRAYDTGSAEEPNPPLVLNYGYWNQAFKARLKQETITTVTEETPNVRDNFELTYVFERLAQVTNQLNTEIAKNVAQRSEKVFLTDGVLLMKGNGNQIPEKEPVNPLDPGILRELKELDCRVKPIGIGDYLKVEQKTVCYKAGEIAHVENILKSEHKERQTRELRQREETIFTSTEREEEQLRDLQTTDRFELQKESERVIGQDMQLSAGVNVSYTTGVTTISGGASFAVQTTQQEAVRSASNYARSVTERASQRVMTRVKEEQTVRLFYEFEETNKHGFDNTAGDGHVVGIFRWINKEYECRLMNYGQRMMFCFMVPEPAAFYLHAATIKPNLGGVPAKPKHPVYEGIDFFSTGTAEKLATAFSLTEFNYARWLTAYGVTDADPYPQAQLKVGKSFSVKIPEGSKGETGNTDIPLPDGYVAWQANVKINPSLILLPPTWIPITPGGPITPIAYGAARISVSEVETFSTNFGGAPSYNSHPLWDDEKSVPVSYTFMNMNSGSFNITIYCKPTQRLIDQWNLKTFEKILLAYERRLAEFNDAMAALSAQAGIQIEGANPLRYREIERNELKRGCVQLLTSESYFNQFNAMERPDEYQDDSDLYGYKYPWFKNCEAVSEGSQVQFFEMAFEWEIMTYLFHPYWWGRPRQWMKLFQAEDADPIFTSFLEAGYAQVIVPVRPGYEKLVAKFMESGQIWAGEGEPAIAPGKYLEYINAINSARNTIEDNGPQQVGNPWKITLPTNLVILQEDANGIPGDGLPCDPDGI